MEILEPSDSPNAWPRAMRCPTCRALLAVDQDDIYRNEDFTGDFTSWFITCPACLEAPDVPRVWWDMLHRLFPRGAGRAHD